MLLLALVMIPLIAVPFVFDLSGTMEDTLLALDWLIWSVFGFELIAKTYLSQRRVDYLRRHWFDVLIVALPFLRPLRVVRSARAFRLMRASRVVAASARAIHSLRSLLDAHGLKYVLLIAGGIVIGAAALVFSFERGNDGTIKDFDDALWWAMTTVTTVGYGDKFPVTAEGRAVAVFLMVTGIALFSVLTASVAAFLVKPEHEGPSLEDVMGKLQQLEAQIEELKTLR